MFTETAELYDPFYEWKDYAGEAGRLREIVEARAPHARTLLDVACGTGRHLEHLRAWYDVEGVDLDVGLLGVARTKLPAVPLHAADMRDFDLGRRFDVVTCLFSSIGYVQTIDGLQSALASMARHLAPDGLLLVEPWLTPSSFDPTFPSGAVVVERPGLVGVRLDDSRVEGHVSIMDFHYLVGRPGQPVEHLVEDAYARTLHRCRAPQRVRGRGTGGRARRPRSDGPRPLDRSPRTFLTGVVDRGDQSCWSRQG